MSSATLKQYFSYHEMIADFAALSPVIDFDKTIAVAPPMAFFKTDGSIVLGGNFVHFMISLREKAGLPVVPFSCEEHRGYYLISYESYEPVMLVEEEKIEVKAVDTPAKKRSQRNTSK